MTRNSFSDSPLYRAESWERDPQESRFYQYHSSPRITRHQFTSSHQSYSCLGSCIPCQVKEKCAIWRFLCCINCRQKGHCSCQLKQVYKHYFFSKSLVLVLLLSALYATAVFRVTSQVLQAILGQEYFLLQTLLLHGVTQVMFPVAGHLADLYIGRHNVIRCSLWIAWLALAILGLTLAIDNAVHTLSRYLVLPIAAIMLSVSYVCFMSNIIPFGLDQMQGASHTHLSSFFYWWYWMLNIGSLINIPQYHSQGFEIGILIQAEIGLVCISVAIILDALLKHWFVIEPVSKNINPLTQIITILRAACRASDKRIQQIPSVVFHEVDVKKFGRMDRIKKRYGGMYETEAVEDVRTFCRILLVLVGIGFSALTYMGVSDTIPLMEANMNGTLTSLIISTSLCEVDISLLSAINALVLLVLLPVLDLLVVPLFRYAFVNPSILCRLVFGSVLVFVTAFVTFIVHLEGDLHFDLCIFHPTVLPLKMDISVYWILLPTVLLTVSEVFIFIPGLEFICAQAPYNMRGLLVGVFFSVIGIFSVMSVLTQYLFMTSPNTFPLLSCGGWYYLAVLLLSVLGLSITVVVCYRYKARKRDDTINDVTMIEEIFVSYLNKRNTYR